MAKPPEGGVYGWIILKHDSEKDQVVLRCARCGDEVLVEMGHPVQKYTPGMAKFVLNHSECPLLVQDNKIP